MGAPAILGIVVICLVLASVVVGLGLLAVVGSSDTTTATPKASVTPETGGGWNDVKIDGTNKRDRLFTVYVSAKNSTTSKRCDYDITVSAGYADQASTYISDVEPGKTGSDAAFIIADLPVNAKIVVIHVERTCYKI